MRGLKESSEEELFQMSIQALKRELAFRKAHASQFTNQKINKLAMKYVYRIEKVLHRKVAAEQEARRVETSG
jgi:lysine/ornithine N-monooxygenase